MEIILVAILVIIISLVILTIMIVSRINLNNKFKERSPKIIINRVVNHKDQ